MHKSDPVIQKGLENAQATLDWVAAQQLKGKVANILSELVVMGCSAGSVGAQLWANKILTTLKWKTAGIVPDSYAGIFPPGSMGPLIYNLGFCTSSGLISDEMMAKCNAQTLDILEVEAENIKNNPGVPIAFVQSKTDSVQQSFYVAVGLSTNTSATITPTAFYNDVNTAFGNYNIQPNFLTYLVDGSQHCFTDTNVFYTADGLGPKDDGSAQNQGLMLSEWVGSWPLMATESASSLCEGALTASEGTSGDNSYCSTLVLPKTFTYNV